MPLQTGTSARGRKPHLLIPHGLSTKPACVRPVINVVSIVGLSSPGRNPTYYSNLSVKTDDWTGKVRASIIVCNLD